MKACNLPVAPQPTPLHTKPGILPLPPVTRQGYITGKANGKTQLTVRTYNGVTAQFTVAYKTEALPLNANAAQLALDHNHVTQVVYGKSVQNRNLESYIITPANGKYKKTLFIDFAIHGFEDDYARDGQRLTAIANHLIAHFASTGGIGQLPIGYCTLRQSGRCHCRQKRTTLRQECLWALHRRAY